MEEREGYFTSVARNYIKKVSGLFKSAYDTNNIDNRVHLPVDPTTMGPVERAYYESNKYMAHEIAKIPFIGEPLIRLGEAVNCSAANESLSPFSKSSPTCQGARDGKSQR